MSLFFSVCSIRSQTNTRSTGGFAERDLNTETSNVPCNWQPDVSEESVSEYRQRGGIGGKLYYPTDYTITNDDKVFVAGQEWDVDGPEMQAHLADAKWVPLFRRVP